MKVRAYKLFYSDGTVARCSTPDDDGTFWRQYPATGLQAVVVYYEETFNTYMDGALHTLPYRTVYCQCDYYWQWGAGLAEEAPSSVVVKAGQLLPDDEWWAIYNLAANQLVL